MSIKFELFISKREMRLIVKVDRHQTEPEKRKRPLAQTEEP